MFRIAAILSLLFVSTCAMTPVMAGHRHQAVPCVETGTVLHPVCGMNAKSIVAKRSQPNDITEDFVLLPENPAISSTSNEAAKINMTRAERREARRRARGQALYDAMPFGVPTGSADEGRRFIRGAAKPAAQARAAGLVPPLAAKAAEIVAACGSQIISAVRHTFVAGTRRISLHASGEAVDLRGNPSCIYAHLKGWPGGYSTDYGRARHVHVSYSSGGREWGVRFAHGGGRRAKHRRYARAL